MSGALPNFFSGLAQGAVTGYDTVSTGMYRKSIMEMRKQQAAAGKAAAAAAGDKTNAGTIGALMAPNGKLLPGQVLPRDTNMSAYLAQLPANQVAAARAGAVRMGFTPQQIAASFGSTTAPAALPDAGAQQDPAPMDTYQQDAAAAQNNAPAQQAKGGAVPRYAVGGMAGGSSAGAGMPNTDYGAAPGMTSYLNQMLSQQGTYSPYGQQPMPGQAKGGTVPPPRYAIGGTIDPDVGAAAGASNSQPQAIPVGAYTPAPASAPPPAAPPSAAPPQAIPAAVPPSAPPPQGAMPAGSAVGQPAGPPSGPAMAPSPAGKPTPPPPAAPPGGMAHPVPQGGVMPPANLNKPQPAIPAAALATAVPAQAALLHGQVAMGLHPSQNPGANPAQAKANYVELQHGAGAASNAVVQHLRLQVNGPDATKNDPLGIQNASMLNNLYNYDMQRFGPQAAAADSFAVLQNYRINMQMYGGAAISSFQSGNTEAAAHYLEQAYAFFPDGNDVKVTPGPNGSLVATRTNLDGKVIDTSTFATPNDLNAFVMQSSSFESYNNYVATAQKAAVADAQISNIHDEMGDRDATTADDGARTAADTANIGNEIINRNQTTADDNKRTQYTISGGAGAGKTKGPSASEISSYDSAIGNGLNGPAGSTIGYDKWAPSAQLAFQGGTTALGLANNLPPSSAIVLGKHIINNPKTWNPKDGTATVNGRTYQLGDMNSLMQQLYGSGTQAKATGGVVTPAARAMADLPT